ncbi:MAG: MGMT family protein, partial [Bacteroidales bacterium]|nr:MGMT family protein [Bacteroidales bacterium]
WGGRTLVIAPPLDYDKYMKLVPEGKLITTNELRKKVATDYRGVDVCCPLTCGIFVQIAAWASYQRGSDETPFWRTLKANGELNSKYPEAYDLQKKKLEEEGHTIIEKGKTNKKFFVKDYEKDLFNL